MGAAVKDPHVGGVNVHATLFVGESAEDVDLGAHGDISRPIQLGVDGNPWDWGELEEFVVGDWAEVSMDSEPIVVAEVVRSDIEVDNVLSAVEEGSDSKELWGGDGRPERLRHRREDGVVLSWYPCQNVQCDVVWEGRDEDLRRWFWLFHGGHWRWDLAEWFLFFFFFSF